MVNIVTEGQDIIPMDRHQEIAELTEKVGALTDAKKAIEEKLKMSKSELEMMVAQYGIDTIEIDEYFVKVLRSQRFSKWDSNKKVYGMIPDDMKATLVTPDRKKILAEIEAGNLTTEILEHQVFKEMTQMRFKNLRG